MNVDESAAGRLLAFCGRLPAIGGDPAQARDDANFVLACFEGRREELQALAGRAGGQGPELAALRCELEALRAATAAVRQIWQRRFGTALPAAS